MTVHTTDTGPAPEQPNPLLQQIPDLTALRNRLADIKQDLALITSALTEIQGKMQSAENTQACVRATEFLLWMDMAVQKAELEQQARAQFEMMAAMAGQPPEPGILPPLVPNGVPPEPEVPLT